MQRSLFLWASLLLVVCLATPLWACSIPVFRYALERWQADPYEFIVFYRGQFDPATDALAERLAAFELADHEAPANARLQLINLADETDEALLELWESQSSIELPWLVVQHVDADRQLKQVWSSPFDSTNLDLLLTSPVREELARRLLLGDSAVWILLESGDSTQDAAAAKVLERRIAELQSELTLPELATEDLEDGLMSLDPAQLQLSFSLMRVSRDNPAESALVAMLLETEHDLRDFENQPLAFPVFGRGRVLYALVGEGINDETIETACRELIGPCTCQVKDQNPGCDLLMSVAWERLVTPSRRKHPLPTLPGLPEISPTAAVATPSETTLALADTNESFRPAELAVPATPTDSAPPREHAIVSNLAWMVGAAVLVLFFASLLLVSRRAKSTGTP